MPKAFNRGWSSQEDSQLRKLVLAFSSQGRTKWVWLARELCLICKRQRTGKQCRERWQHQLNPQINREGWTVAQAQKLFDLLRKYGNKWSLIAQHLPGRTDNIAKNFFYAFVRKNITKINTILRGERPSNFTSQIRPFDSGFTSKLILVSDGHFQKKIRLNSHDPQSSAREILYRIITLDGRVMMQESLKGSIWDLVQIMHRFRLNSKKKKQSKKTKQDQRFLREDQSNLLTHLQQTDLSDLKKFLYEEAELSSSKEEALEISNAILQNQLSLQEKQLQRFFAQAKSKPPSSQSSVDSDPTAQQPFVSKNKQLCEQKHQVVPDNIWGPFKSQRSYTRLSDSLNEYLTGFNCVFASQCKQEREFNEESPIHMPLHIGIQEGERQFSFRELFGNQQDIPDQNFIGMSEDGIPL